MNRTRSIAVAVYGTLKRGGSNHRLLKTARFIGEDCLTDICLYDLGPYPAAVPGHSEGVTVEIFKVNAGELEQLDALEDHRPQAPRAGLYRRRQLQTRHGLAWLYLYNRSLRNGRLVSQYCR